MTARDAETHRVPANRQTHTPFNARPGDGRPPKFATEYLLVILAYARGWPFRQIKTGNRTPYVVSANAELSPLYG